MISFWASDKGSSGSLMATLGYGMSPLWLHCVTMSIPSFQLRLNWEKDRLAASGAGRICGRGDAVLSRRVEGFEAGTDGDEVHGARLGGDGQQVTLDGECDAAWVRASQIERALQGELAEGPDGPGWASSRAESSGRVYAR